MIEMARGKWDEAIKFLESIVQEDPYMTEAVVKLAELEFRIYKNPQRALARLSHAVKVDPNNAEA